MSYLSGMEGEVRPDGKWEHKTSCRTFRGAKIPATFELSVSEDEALSEGQRIGKTRFGQKLYWEQGQILARG